MSIRIDVKELMEVLDNTPANQNIMLVGKHGIGKSQILTQYYQKKGMPVIALFLGQMSDPGDLIGLPHKDPDTGRSEFMPPYWWPSDGRPTVLFLDELNRARPELLQSVQDLTLNRTLAGKKLPEGSVVLSAVNAGDEYQLTDLDPALLSRFNIYEFVPSVEDWGVWARKNGIDKRVITFIEKNSSFIDPQLSDTSDELIEKTADRRAWVRVSDIVGPHKSLGLSLIKIVAGVVGVNAAMAFKKFVESFQAVSPEQLLLKFTRKLTKELDSLSLQDIIYLNKQVIFWLDENIRNMAEAKRKKALSNLEKYIIYLKETDRREAIADLINQVESSDCEYACSFIMLESPEIMKLLEKYIHGVKL